MFWFRLALALGMSVRRAQMEISSREFSEWVAYYNVEPFGDMRADLRNAVLCSLVGAMFRKKGQKAPELSEFMFNFESKRRVETPEQMKAKFKQMARMFGSVKKAK